MKDCPIKLKFAPDTRNDGTNSKILVPDLKNQSLTTPKPHPSKNQYRQNALKIRMDTKNDTKNSKILVPDL